MKKYLAPLLFILWLPACQTLTTADALGNAYSVRSSLAQQNMEYYRAGVYDRQQYADYFSVLSDVKKALDVAYSVYTAGGSDAQVQQAVNVADQLLLDLTISMAKRKNDNE